MMNNLIKKAIDAIQAGKNDYAIGLLEGLLELNGQTTKSSQNIPNTYFGGTGTDIAGNGIVPGTGSGSTPNVADVVEVLERGVTGKLDALKANIKTE